MTDIPQGYETQDLPKDYTGKVWIEGQLRAYGQACAAEERERLMPLIDDAILDAVGAALAGAGYANGEIEAIAPRVLEMWRGFKSAAAIRATSTPRP